MLAASFVQTLIRPMKTLALALLFPLAALADNEIGFIERFALATDREKALGELVPGSEEYYFFHALHYQNVRDTAKLNDLLNEWRQRTPDENEARRVILNREAILHCLHPSATSRSMRSPIGGCVEKSDESRPPLNGLTM